MDVIRCFGDTLWQGLQRGFFVEPDHCILILCIMTDLFVIELESIVFFLEELV